MRLQGIQSGKRRRDAFTIVEIIAAAVVISIGAAALMGCTSYAFYVTQLTRENQRATQIMVERAEAIRLCNWEQVKTAGFIPATFTDYYDPTATNGSSGVVYRGTVSITPFTFPTSYATNMRTLTLTLQWQSGRVSHSRTHVTNISQDGIHNYVF